MVVTHIPEKMYQPYIVEYQCVSMLINTSHDMVEENTAKKTKNTALFLYCM
jgi:hypothetical protein